MLSPLVHNDQLVSYVLTGALKEIKKPVSTRRKILTGRLTTTARLQRAELSGPHRAVGRSNPTERDV